MKNFKKNILKPIMLASLTVGAVSLASCGRDSGGDLDPSKLHLFLYHYQGGMGNKWLYNNIEKYEKLHANDKYGDKTGVQIVVDESTNRPNSVGIKTEKYALYYYEELDFNSFYDSNSLEDITDVVNNNPYEPSKSIASKLTETQQNYFGVGEGADKKYFAVPYYSTTTGITYNKTVFDDNGFYFNDDYESAMSLEDKFISEAFPNKSAGPNGIAGDYDDGLPVTYQDFYDLCDYIKSCKVVPFTCYEKNDQDYTGFLLSALAASHEGAKENIVNYTMDGEITVAEMDGEGVALNADGTVKTSKVTVDPAYGGETKANGYNVQRSFGKYYALSFMRKLVNEWDKGWSANVVSANNSQFDVQNWFIDSQFGTNPAPEGDWQRGKPIAMMIEGNWWYSEASSHINGLSERQKSQLNYGWMPLPRANKTDANTKLTYLDTAGSMSFVNKSRPDLEKQVAKDFLAFTCTDESLNDFTACTNGVMAYKYELTESVKNNLSSFGKSMMNIYELSDKIYPVSRNAQFRAKLSSTSLSRRWSISSSTTWPITEFKKNSSMTASDYLYKMYTNYKSFW